ncbi:conserved hypothetical protein [Xanthomonas citri pv. citri]|nr:conserved hypothetical protein [Xanthomonas citri pv. citri]CEE30649.1 conserved hypothetical protein [Xanthomonas citri pv. citri]CEE54990.1 conserved hypothetical protein [Xanthomonas citri pv. citri]CEH37912.1 conserved hypothetical protein [Xanthomonas citri pv. citri]CEH84458.1 conserved hypothetical protein [Xanthomonas citri pv. citri]
MVLRHMPQFTPDEWAALAEMLNERVDRDLCKKQPKLS